MAPNAKGGKAVSRPLPSSLAPGDASSANIGGDKKTYTSINSNSAKVRSGRVDKIRSFKFQSADSNEEMPKRAVASTKSDDGEYNCTESDDETPHHRNTGAKAYNGGDGGSSDDEPYEDGNVDGDYLEEGSDFEEKSRTSAKKAVPGRQKQKYEMKKKDPNPNGRVPGRKLVMWHRPRMVEKLLLHLQYECHREGIKLPWDKVVHRLSTGSSGQSALQHINKLRDILITEGHMVPPLLGKNTIPQDPMIRGFIRDMNAEKPTETRVVCWGEHIEDRKENLEVEGIIRGSGNYRRAQVNSSSRRQRGLAKALERNQHATGMRRNRLPVELRQSRTDSDPVAGTDKRRFRERKRSAATSCAVDDESADSADSSDEYKPSGDKKKGKCGFFKAQMDSLNFNDKRFGDETVEEAGESYRESVPASAFVKTPQKNRVKSEEQCEGLMTPPPTSKIVKFQVRTDLLSRLSTRGCLLDKRVSEVPVCLDRKNPVQGMVRKTLNDSTNDDAANDEYEEEFDEIDSPTRQSIRGSSIHPFVKDTIRQKGGLGIEVHGTTRQYEEALANGLTTTVNSLMSKNDAAATTLYDGVKKQPSPSYKLAPPPVYNSYGARMLANPSLMKSSRLLAQDGSAYNASGAVVGGMTRSIADVLDEFERNQEALFSNAHGAGQMTDDPFFENYGQSSEMFSKHLSPPFEKSNLITGSDMSHGGSMSFGLSRFMDGSGGFHNGLPSFGNSGMPSMSYDYGQNDFAMGATGMESFDTFNSFNSSSTVSSSSASGFQISPNLSTVNTTTTTATATPALNIYDGAGSFDQPGPLHQHPYNQEDDKENVDIWTRA